MRASTPGKRVRYAASTAGTSVTDTVDRTLQVLHHPQHRRQESLAHLKNPYFARRAVKQAPAQVFFEVLHEHPQSRLRDTQLPDRSLEIFRLGDGGKGPHLTQRNVHGPRSAVRCALRAMFPEARVHRMGFVPQLRTRPFDLGCSSGAREHLAAGNDQLPRGVADECVQIAFR